MSLKIDLDDGIEYAIPAGRRPPGGVQIRKDPATGADVFMYKRRPGVYYSANGTEVSQTMAERSGFDVKYLAILRKQQADLAHDQALRDAEMKGKIHRVVEERNGFRLEEHPRVGFIVFRVDNGERVSSPAPSEAMGKDWLNDFAGPLPEQGFNGTPESVKVADGDIQRADNEGGSRADRRPGQDAKPARNIR